MVAGPEIARLLTEFEKNEIDRRSALELRLHEQTEGAQKKFIGEVKKLTEIIRSYGNPFLKESKELLVLDSRSIVDSETARLVSEIEKIGQKQYGDFVEKRILNGGEAFFSPIRKINSSCLVLPQREKERMRKLNFFLKNDVSLFSQLYIASQVRKSDLDIFFQHENQPIPPSISNNGDLKMGTKSTLIECLEEKVIDYQHPKRPKVDAHVIDGAAAINMLKP